MALSSVAENPWLFFGVAVLSSFKYGPGECNVFVDVAFGAKACSPPNVASRCKCR
jgi:hypothetical protein